MPDDAPALLQQRRTKIIATLPAADATAATVDELAACGVDAVLLVGDPSLAECTTPTEQASDRVVSKASKKIPLPVLVDLGDCDLNATAESFGPKECFAILPLTTGDAIRVMQEEVQTPCDPKKVFLQIFFAN